MAELRSGIRRLRATAAGRLALVLLLAVVAYAGWNLTARPYQPSGSFGSCGAPISVALSGPGDAEYEMRTVTDVEALVDYLRGQGYREFSPEWRQASDRVEERFQKTVRVKTDLYGDMQRQACLDGLKTADFWLRGLGPVAALIAVAAAGWFVIKGGRSADEAP